MRRQPMLVRCSILWIRKLRGSKHISIEGRFGRLTYQAKNEEGVGAIPTPSSAYCGRGLLRGWDLDLRKRFKSPEVGCYPDRMFFLRQPFFAPTRSPEANFPPPSLGEGAVPEKNSFQ